MIWEKHSYMTNVRSGRLLFLVAAVSMAIIPVCADAQTAAMNDRPLAFEVISIRRDTSAPTGRDEIAVTRDGWHAAHESLFAALLTAYVPTTPDAMMYTTATLAGIPDWMRTELYDIDARIAPSDLEAWHDPAKQ